MTRLVPIALLAALVTAASPPPAHGWNDSGHMMVAYIAYQDLTPPTRARANALIRMNPSYRKWLAWLPEGASKTDRDMMLFMIAATWPDQIKRDSRYISDGIQNGNHPEGSPDPRANRGYGDRLMHKYWHFVDTFFSDDGTPLPPIPSPHAAERIARFRGVIGSNAKDSLKSYDLVWLLHLVGDIHQPLHCAARVNAAAPEGDGGGNGVQVSCPGCPRNLHAFWDGLPGNLEAIEAALGPAITAARSLPGADPALVAKQNVKGWVGEGFRLALEVVYVSPIAAGPGPFALTEAYETTARAVALERVALAGARLARLLNTRLK